MLVLPGQEARPSRIPRARCLEQPPEVLLSHASQRFEDSRTDAKVKDRKQFERRAATLRIASAGDGAQG